MDQVKILIIDDDPQNRDILKTRLELAGYLVGEAANGDEGIEISLKEHHDLIICDLMMPRKDGWQVLKSLRSEPKTQDVPVIILTARTQPIDEMRSWESGASEFLAKPVDHELLIQTVQRLLNGKEAAHGPQENPGH